MDFVLRSRSGGFFFQSLLGGSGSADVVPKILNFLDERLCGQKLPKPDQVLKGTQRYAMKFIKMLIGPLFCIAMF